MGLGASQKNTKKQKHKKSLFRREDERSSNRSRGHAVHHVLQVCVDHANTTKARYEIARVGHTDPSPEYIPPTPGALRELFQNRTVPRRSKSQKSMKNE